MAEGILQSDQILAAAENLLRRHGLAKTTVVDVARALGVSHGSIYRHYPSKAALRDAVAAAWLHKVSAPLAEIASKKTVPEKRLLEWLEALIAIKKRKVLDDPELFAAYHALAEEAREVVAEHVEELISQLESIVADGLARKRFRAGDARSIARAVLLATSQFHHPAHSGAWLRPTMDAEFQAVWNLISKGLLQP